MNSSQKKLTSTSQTRVLHGFWEGTEYENSSRPQGGEMSTENMILNRKTTGLNSRPPNSIAGRFLRGMLLASVFMGLVVATNANAQLINVVSATSSTPDPTPANNGGVGAPTLPPVDSGVAGGVAENNRTATLINPRIAKAFNPTSIALGGISTLTFTITNPNAVPITAATLTDSLPSTVVVANPPAVVNTTCNFTGGLPVANATSLSLTGGTIPASGSCTFAVNVTAPGAGVYNNTTFATTGSATPFSGANPVAVASPTPTPASLTVTNNTGPAYACDGAFYQIRATGTPGLSRLFQINRPAFSQTPLTPLNSLSAVLNGLGYNPVDNFLYAIYLGVDADTPSGTSATQGLYRIGTTGFDSVGPISGLPNGFQPTAADFDSNGDYYVTEAGGSNRMYRINVSSTPPSATLITLTPATANIGDMSLNPVDGFLYGAINETSGVKIDKASGAVTPITITGVPAGEGNWGTTYMDTVGNWFAYANNGFLYQIDTQTGAATRIQSGLQTATRSDGAACAFPAQRLDVVKSAGTPVQVSANTFDIPFTVSVKNTGPQLAPNVQLTENLARTFVTGTPTITVLSTPAITSTTPATCAVSTVNSAFNGVADTRLLNGNGSLAVGATCTITFTARVAYAAAAPTTAQNNTVFASSSSLAGNPGYTFTPDASGTPTPPGNLLAADLSTNGTALPNTPNTDTPTPTPILLPQLPTLGIAKAIEPGAAAMLTPLSFTVPYTLRFAVPASSTTAATNVQVVDNLSTTFPGATTITVGTRTITGLNAGSNAVCVAGALNTAYTGQTTETNVLADNSTLSLAAGQGCSVAFVVTVVYPDAATFAAGTVKNNSATMTSAATPGGTALVSDVSDNGTNPDPTNNNGAGTTNDPTPLGFSTITGNVFQDNDASGTNNAGDAPLSGVTVNVTNNTAGSPTLAVPTNATGDWSAIVPVSSTATYTVNVDDATLPAGVRTNATTGRLTTAGSDPENTVAAPTAVGTPRTTTNDGYGRVADLAVDKVANTSVYVVGDTVTYTIKVWNRGPASPLSGVTFSDTIPSNITLTNWACAGSTGATCSAASGTTQATLNAVTFGNLITNATTVAPTTGNFVTITITGTANAAGASVANTANVTAPTGVLEATGAGTSPNTSTATVAINTPSSLTQVKSIIGNADGLAQAGETITYRVVINNAGGTVASGVTFSDIVPANTTLVPNSGTTTSTTGSIISTASPVTGSGLTVPAGGSINVDFQVTVNTPLPANVVNIANQATVNGNPTNTVTTPTVPDLIIAKSTLPAATNFVVGQTGTFQFVITNQGGSTTTPTTAGAITFTDTLPVGLTRADGTFVPNGANGANWSCNAVANVVTCSSVAGVSLAAGASNTVTFQVNVGATADTGATPDSTNTATVQGGGEPSLNYNNNNSGSTPVNADPRADVTTTVNVTTTPRIPGDTISGTVDFRNAGPSPAAGVTSSITFPTGLTGGSVPTVTCTPNTVTAGAYNAATGVVTLSGIPNPLPSSATPNYTCNISYVVPANATADQVISSNIGTTTNQGANTLPDTSSVIVPLNSTDLQVAKTDTPASPTYTPGQNITYTVTVTNAGPDAVTGARVFDTVPANLTVSSVTCVGTACPPAPISVAAFTNSTTAPLGVALGNLTVAPAAGSTATFTVNATVSNGATGNLVNSATVNVPAGFGDPTPGNNTATDTNTSSGTPVDLTIAKTDIAPAFVVGQTGNYRLTVSNAAGSVGTSGTITVSDTLPAGITVPNSPPNLTLSGTNAANWTCTAASNVITCTSSTSIAGGGSSVFEFPVSIGAAAAPSVTNTATVSGGGEPPANNGNNTGTDITPVTPVADLSVVKTDGVGVTTAPAGGQVTYTVTVSNAGPNSVTGAIVSDPTVANLNVTSVTCAETAGGTIVGCPTGTITPAAFATGVTLGQLTASGADSSVVFTVIGTVTANSGSIVNTARVLAPAPGAGVPVDPTDPTRIGAGNNSSTDTDTITPQAIGVAKTANIITSGAGLPTPPTYRVRYSVLLENTGTINATNVQISENLERTYTGVTPANINVVGGSISATRSGSGTASGTECVANTSFTGKDAAGTTFNSTNMTLLDGSGTLEPGERCTVQFDVDVLFPASNTAFDNTAYGSTSLNPNNPGVTVPDTGATSNPTGTLTTDLSDNGTSPTTNNGAGGTDDPTPIRLVRVTGKVFQDDDANGTNAADPADAGINNVSVVLTSGGATPISTTVTTNATGDWQAFVPAGTYNVNVDDSTLPNTVRTNATTGNRTTGTSDGTGAAGAGETVVVAVPSNGTDPVTTTDDGYARVADVLISKTALPTTVTQGGSIAYTIKVWNNGPAVANGVAFTDVLPTGITLTNWTCAGSGGATCSAASGTTLATLNAVTLNMPARGTPSATEPTTGEFVTITVNAATSNTTPTGASNNLARATVPGVGNVNAFTDPTTNGTGPNPTRENEDSATVTVNTPSNLTLGKSVVDSADADTLAQAGETLTYTISVQNTGGTATNVTITDAIPANTTYVAGSASNGGTFATPTVTWTSVPVAAGTTVTRTFQVTVNTPLPANVTQISNTAVVDDLNDPAPGNSTPPADINTVPDLILAKSTLPAATNFVVGQTGTFQFVITNQGGSTTTPTTAGAITFTDTLPVGLTRADGTFVPNGANGANWSCNAVANVVTCSSVAGVSLAAGASNTVTFQVNVGATADTGATPDSTNTATVQGGGEPSLNYNNNNSGSTPVNADPRADLQIVKDNGATSVAAGGTTSYTVRVTNNGPSPVPAGAVVNDPLVAGLTKTSVTCVGAACPTAPISISSFESVGGGVTLGALANGATAVFTVVADVTATTGDVNNIANIVSSPVTDPTPGNNIDNDQDPVTGQQIGVAKAITSTTQVNANTVDIAYSIVLENTGTTNATNVQVVENFLRTFSPLGTADIALQGAPVITPSGGAVATDCAPATTAFDGEGNNALLSGSSTLAPNERCTIALTVRVSNIAATTYNNTAYGSTSLNPNNPGLTVPNDPAQAPTAPAGTIAQDLSDSGTSPTGNNGAGGNNDPTPLVFGSITGVVFQDTDGNGSQNGTEAGVGAPVDVTLTPSAGAPLTVQTNPTTGAWTAIVPLNSGLTYNVNVVDSTLPATLRTSPTAGNLTTTGSDPEATVAAPTTATPTRATTNDGYARVADVRIQKTAASATVTVGGAVTYTITVWNGGPAVANSIAISDVLPAGVTLNTWSCAATGTATCSAASGSAIGTLNALTVNLPVNASVPAPTTGSFVTITVNGTAATPGSTNNIARATTPAAGSPDFVSDPSTNGTGPNPTRENEDGAPVTINTPSSLVLNKVVNDGGDGKAQAGETLTYTISVQNTGGTATNVTITDAIPANTTYVAGSASNSGTEAGGTVTWTSVPVAAGATVTRTFQVTVNTPLPANVTDVTNVALVDDLSNPDPANSTPTVVTPTVPDLIIVKSDTGATFTVGLPGTYNFTVTNQGGSPTTGTITVADTLPTGLTVADGVVASGNAAWTCNAATNVITCTSTTAIAIGGSSNFSVAVIPTAAAVPSVSNTASVQGGGEPSTNYNNNNTGSDTTPVAAQQINVVKAAPARVTPVVGTPFAYDIPYAVQVSNTGTVPATNVQVVDNLVATYPSPAVISIQSAATVSSGTCTLNPTAFNGVSQTALLSGSNTLAPGASCIIKFTVRVTYPNAAVIPTSNRENTAVASTDDVPNPTGTNPSPLSSDNSTTTLPNGAGDPTNPPVAGDVPSPTPTQLNQPPVTQDRTNDPLALNAAATVLNPNLLGTDPDGTVVSYKITSLPTNGTLALGGVPITPAQVAAGFTVPATQLGTLTFDPDGTAPAGGSTSFTYAAIDNTGLEDSTPNTYSIPLGNEPPTTVDRTNVPVNAGDAAAPLALSPVAPVLSGNDPDGTVDNFVVTSLPTAGTLLYNGVPVVANTTLIPNTPADLALVTYLPSTTQPTAPVTFQYAARDNNGLQDGTPATYTIPYNVQQIDAVKTAGAATVISATSYSVPITVKVGNTGTIPATKVQVVENLARTFQGATSITISSYAVAPSAGATCTAATPSINGAVTGSVALLAGSDTLQPGQNCTITFTATVVFPDVATATTVRNNQVFASTSAQPGNNPGHTVPNDPATPPTPPTGALATDNSTNSPNLPATPNSDTPSPTPISPVTNGTLNGLVFEDKNSNGVQDPGELGIGNVPVTVTPAGGGAPIVVNTNPDGTYSVPNLPLGSTRVEVVTDPTNSVLTTPATDPQNVNIVPGTNPAADIGFVFVGNIKGNVFIDANGNGSQAGTNETGFAAQVKITNGAFTITVPADPVTGAYTADNVPVGTVTVEVLNSSIPATLKNSSGVPNQTAGVNPSVVTVTTANTTANRADAGADGFQPNPPVAVNDSAITASDTNVDIPVLTNDSSTTPNTKDPTSVKFTPTGQPAGSTVSPDGKTLTVPGEGTYTINPTTGVVTFDPEPTFTGTTTSVQYTFKDNAGLPSNPALITVNVGTPTKGTVTGLVFRDDNGNGTKDPTEPGIGNVDVIVTPAGGGAPITVSTNPDGTWSAPGVPAGNATVKVQTTDPDFLTGATLTTAGSDPSNVTVVAGGTVADARDGFRFPAPATAPDTANTPNNTPVNNIPVLGNDTASSPLTLVPSSVVFPTAGQPAGSSVSPDGKTLTNPSGTYTINPDGTVNFVPTSPAITGVQPPVKYTVTDSSGNVSAPTDITITVGTIGAGTLQGIVFFDDNGSGAQDGSEKGIPNVQVTLTPVGGGAAIPVTTDANGKYSANVPAGNYVVQIVDSSLPVTVKTGTTPNQTAGNNSPTNPVNTTTVVAGAVANADPDGYRLNPPVAVNDANTTPVNTPITFTLTGNDDATIPANIVPSTVDLDPSTPAQDTTRTVPEGQFVVNGIGEVTFTPNPNFSGNVTPITYTVLDSTTQKSNPATVNVVVTPTAANDTATTPVNTPVQIPVLGNDVGSKDPTKVFFPTTGQPVGAFVSDGGRTLTIPEGEFKSNPTTGVVTFTPVNGFIGAVPTVKYTMTDNVTTRTANIDVTVAAEVGSLRGVVFRDLDGNGSQGAGEQGIPNIDVVLTNGSFTRTVTTDANGVYTADNVPTGTVTVDVNTNDTDFPAALKTAGVPNQTAGVDPSVVTVAVTNTPASPANAGADGYRPAAPKAVNDTATTPADTNVDIPVLTNDTSDNGKDPTSVIFTPTGQPVGSTVSPDGKTLTVPGEGTYTINPTTGVVTFDPEPTFSGSATPVQYTYKDTNGQPSNPAQIAVTVGTPNKGNITGKVFEDTNGNGTQQAGEPNLENVQVTITPASGAPITVLTDANGVYTALNLPVGNAVVDIVDSSLPAKYKNPTTGVPNQTAGNDPTNASNVAAGSSVTIAAGTTVNQGIDGYRPNPPVAINDARVAPNTTTPVNNIPVLGNDTSSNPLVPSSVVFPTTGQPTGSTVSPNGKQITVPGNGTYTINPDGTVNFVPDPAFNGTPVPVKYTVQDNTGQTSNPATLTISAPGNPALATVVGKVYRDDNGNSTQNGSEPGLENISVTVSNGTFTATVQTAPDGTYSVPNVPLGSPVTVTVVSSSIPTTLKNPTTGTPNQTEGTNPTVITTPVAGINNAGNDGFRLNPPVANPDKAVTPLNTPITFSLTGNDKATNPANIAPDTIDLDPITAGVQTTRDVPEGRFAVNGVGEVTFTPKTDFSGNVTQITYTVLDSTGQRSNVTTVDVTVLPISSDDTAQTPQDTPVTIPVLTNDKGNLVPSTVVVVKNPTNGTTTVNPDGTIKYTPNLGFFGTDTFDYKVCDTAGSCTVSKVTVTVNKTTTARLEVPVFNDDNGNGVRDPGETAIPNATVTLYEVDPTTNKVRVDTSGNPVRLKDAAGNPIPPVQTDANGVAVFPAVPVGKVGVVVTDPAGKVLTTNNNIQIVDIKPNTVNKAPAVGYVPPKINLTITPDRQVVTPGDNLPYTSVITNNTPGTITPLKNPVYTVTLPKGVTYDPSKPITVQVPGGKPIVVDKSQISTTTNAQGEQVLTIKMPNDLKNGEPVTVKFDTIVGANINTKEPLIAKGTVTGTAQNPSLNGVPVSVNASSGSIAAAAVKVTLGVFDNSSVIVGRVYFDNNNNNNFDAGDRPLPGARVYMSDGRSAVTDSNGRYSVPNVAPGTYVVRLDPVTAPYAVKRVPEDLGSPGSRHVRASEIGGVVNADFLLSPPQGAAVKARSTTVQRGPVTIIKSMVQGGAGYAVTIRITLEKAVSNLSITDPLPANSSRGPVTVNGTTTTPNTNGNVISIPGTLPAGSYTMIYPLFSALPPDLALTDPDIDYEELLILIHLEPQTTETSSPSTPFSTATAVEEGLEISRKFGDEVIQ